MKARLIGTLVAVLVLGGVVVGAGSSSRALTQAARGRTQTNVKASVKRAVYGQQVKLIATVTRLSGSGKLSGKVEFYDGVTKIGAGVVVLSTQHFSGSNTSAPLPYFEVDIGLAVGRHTITAVYSGNSNFGASTSRKLNLNVGKATASTEISEVPAATLLLPAYGEVVKFRATVTGKAPSHGHPTGTVTFFDGSKPLGSSFDCCLGVLIGDYQQLAVGRHAITAVYTGSASFKRGTSRVLTLTVRKAQTTLVATSKTTSSAGGPPSVTFTVTVTAVAPGAGTPTGAVTFSQGSKTLGSATLKAGTGTLTLNGSEISATGAVTATYSGDGNFSGSSSSVK